MSGSSKFTVNLGSADAARYGRLIAELEREVGTAADPRGPRTPSRADVLRAMLTVTEENLATREAVHRQLRADLALDAPSIPSSP